MQENQTVPVESLLLASILTSYPDNGFKDNVKVLLESAKEQDLSLLNPRMKGQMVRMEGDIDELRSEYIDLFDRGSSANPLYETEYGRDRALVKGNELADISGFYKAFGFELEQAGPDQKGNREGQIEMLDHVAVELEFYSLLRLKEEALDGDAEGVEIVRDARKKFLKDHLGRFVRAISERPSVSENRFYGAVFEWCADLIEGECKGLGLEIDRAHWVTQRAISEDSQFENQMKCGGFAKCSD